MNLLQRCKVGARLRALGLGYVREWDIYGE